VGAPVLRILPGLSEHIGAAETHEQRAIRVEQDSGCRDAVVQPVSHEDVGHLGQGVAVEEAPGQRDRQGRFALELYRLGVRQEDDAIIVRVDRNVHEPGTVPTSEHLRHAWNVLLHELPIADHAEAALTFGHQDVTVTSERHTPRMGEPADNRHHADFRHHVGVDHDRLNRWG